MKETYLIQRLNRPYNKATLSGLAEVFSFGGGLQNGGLSPQAMDLLRPLFSFDYMGSAEFEWGAIPDSLSNIATKRAQYGAWTIDVKGISVYVVGIQDNASDINLIINKLADDKVQLKEASYFKPALGLDKYFKKENCRTIGWLELDNHFAFFIDREVFQKFTDLFTIPIQTPA